MPTRTRLVDAKTGAPVYVGDRRETFRGETCEILGMRSPHKESSTGFVSVRFEDSEPRAFGREFYAGVVGCKFIEPEDN